MKCISVPVNKSAMQRLDLGQSQDGDLLEFVLNDDEYCCLCNSGVIDSLNQSLAKLIDDYEDEHICQLNELAQARTIVTQAITPENSHVLSKLLVLVEEAIKYQTGVFFFF